jgi:uncharacterized protein (UPF0276 family)
MAAPMFGVGLRAAHAARVMSAACAVDFFEIISENFLGAGEASRALLRHVGARHPISMHGVSLSIGGTDPLDLSLLRQLRALARATGALSVSDHLCWTGVAGAMTGELLPLPHTEAVLRHVVSRIAAAQEILGCRLLIENPSSYLAWSVSEMTEWEFLAAVAERADCLILLDVNNVVVSATNVGFDARRYVESIPPERVAQFHLAGHRRHRFHAVDSHSGPVADEVLDLFRVAWEATGGRPTILEWDTDLPPFDVLTDEVERIRGACVEAVHA